MSNRPDKLGSGILSSPNDKKAAESLLMDLFREKGYTRVPNKRRRKEEGQDYKKGYEVRLPLRTKEELRNVRRALRKVGLKAGKFYDHHSYFVQPVYGKKALEWFVSRGRSTGSDTRTDDPPLSGPSDTT